MLHPVPPPEPPSILQPATSMEASSIELQSSATAKPPVAYSSPAASPPKRIAQSLAAPVQPETLASTPSFSGSTRKAGLLGAPMGVGYPIYPAQQKPAQQEPSDIVSIPSKQQSSKIAPVSPVSKAKTQEPSDTAATSSKQQNPETFAASKVKASAEKPVPSEHSDNPSPGASPAPPLPITPQIVTVSAEQAKAATPSSRPKVARIPHRVKVASPSLSKKRTKQSAALSLETIEPSESASVSAPTTEDSSAIDRKQTVMVSAMNISHNNLLDALKLGVPKQIEAPSEMDFLTRFADAAEFQEDEVLKEFDFRAPSEIPAPEVPFPSLEDPRLPEGLIPEGLPDPEQLPSRNQPTGKTEPSDPVNLGDVVEIISDRQEYDEERRIVTAEGNVVIRIRGSVVDADRAQVNLPNQTLVAEGNVALRQGGQLTRGDRFEYNLVQESGTMFGASGDIDMARTGSDAGSSPPSDISGTVPDRPLSDRISAQQPQTGITSQPGFMFGVGSGRSLIGGNLSSSGSQQGGSINRFRYRADRLDITPEESIATNLRMTNDPFSPPELEFVSKQARFKRLSPLVDEIVMQSPRLVFDGGFSVPTFRRRVVLDRRDRPPGLFNVGFDDGDRGGLFIERTFQIISSDRVSFTVTPQVFTQRMLFGRRGPTPGSPREDRGPFTLANYGFRSALKADLGAGFSLDGEAAFTSLDPEQIPERTRAKVRLRRPLGDHNLAAEYTYRDRLFNGSLGFQNVRSSFGIVLTSPVYNLGNSGVLLNYQGSIQNVVADTDRARLLASTRRNNRVNLTRYQASASVSKGFTLWRGKALPATRTEGMRYTPSPLVPSLGIGLGLTGVLGQYSNGERQQSLRGSVSLGGQFGNFSRPFLDYTAFNVTYSQSLRAGESPFFFDRDVDRRTIDLNFTQQIYGPFRFGFRTSFNLDTDERISTDYILEYSRRTYNISFRFNPVLEIGSLSLQFSDFNWSGDAGAYRGYPGVRFVRGGVTQAE